MLEALLRPRRVVHAHCDLPCGIYDPAQARVEAESVKAIQTRYQDAEKFKTAGESVEDYRIRALAIKELRADLVKEHLWVLWTDYFKPERRARSCWTRSTRSPRSSGGPRRRQRGSEPGGRGQAPPFVASGSDPPPVRSLD